MEPIEIDFYSVLNIPRDATPEQIAIAYRNMAIECHPHRDSTFAGCVEGISAEKPWTDLKHSAQFHWSSINRAYDVLSNPLRREVYDKFGTVGLQNGVQLPDGHSFEPYRYHGDYLNTYFEAFGSYSPYANLLDAVVLPPLLYTTEKGTFPMKKDPPVEKPLCLDLEDVFFGGIKRMTIIRRELDGIDESAGSTMREKTLTIKIPPGILPGTRITFPEEGDQAPGHIPADITFIVTDRPHNVFVRRKSDLVMNHVIDLKDALRGIRFLIDTIDERKLLIEIKDIIHPQYVHEVKGEGLPIPSSDGEKGSLFIQFEIKFPTVIPTAMKLKVAKLFKEIKTAEIQKSVNSS